ncbi:MAG: hypothetical protein IJN84_03145, partial [Clostridia bacterium]|nr:hypothetical protein [Clostridia bacterium]
MILLSSHIVEDLNCDNYIKDKDRICLTHVFEAPMMPDQFLEIGRGLPATEDLCWYVQSRSKTFFQNLITAQSEEGQQH